MWFNWIFTIWAKVQIWISKNEKLRMWPTLEWKCYENSSHTFSIRNHSVTRQEKNAENRIVLFLLLSLSFYFPLKNCFFHTFSRRCRVLNSQCICVRFPFAPIFLSQFTRLWFSRCDAKTTPDWAKSSKIRTSLEAFSSRLVVTHFLCSTLFPPRFDCVCAMFYCCIWTETIFRLPVNSTNWLLTEMLLLLPHFRSSIIARQKKKTATKFSLKQRCARPFELYWRAWFLDESDSITKQRHDIK